jgi:hypothetical protein
MALDDFIADSQEPQYHENTSLDKAKLHEESLCPGCGEEGKHLRGSEWKCTTEADKCEIITWRNANYAPDNA